MTKDERNEAFAKCLESFPKRYGRINFRDHLILRIAFDFGIDAAIENLNIPELKKTIAELESEVKEWKDKADLWCKTANLKDHNIMINKELEKENAELKDDNKVMADNYSKMEQKFYNNLTKAKEHIQTLISCLIDWVQEGDKDYCHIAEAEQFLSEVENVR